MTRVISLIYCSWSPFKKEEWEVARSTLCMPSVPNSKVGELFQFEFRQVPTQEPLLCDLAQMVRVKAESAYKAVMVPTIVEHAGLILEGCEASSFPGGLTQPMWDAIGGEKFVACCAPISRRAVARAVIGYCDGMRIETFVGETRGTLADKPQGEREFYWDTVFCPDGFDGRTYAEIVGPERKGIKDKIQISQSIKALLAFMEYRLHRQPILFPGL